jgi:hypothetical protein
MRTDYANHSRASLGIKLPERIVNPTACWGEENWAALSTFRLHSGPQTAMC